jgi:hypothetical protein
MINFLYPTLYLGRLLHLSAAKLVGFCGKARLALRDFTLPRMVNLYSQWQAELC